MNGIKVMILQYQRIPCPYQQPKPFQGTPQYGTYGYNSATACRSALSTERN
jgi:hypothetical protein